MRFRDAFNQLNTAQRKAVETIDGPVLVLAGPGTGKTQLLAVRAAYILKQTDALPENILCLTFTDSGQRAMRERLQQFIGNDAHHITISTYHGFGNDILRRFPEFITNPGQRAIDELLQDQLLRNVLEAVPYSNPFKQAHIFLRDIKTFISDAKRALLEPHHIIAIAEANMRSIETANSSCEAHLTGFRAISKAVVPQFEQLLEALADIKHEKFPGNIQSLTELANSELEAALEQVEITGKTAALTAWKNRWLAKNEQGNFVLDGARTAKRLQAVADIYHRYETLLNEQGIIDYDDMIIRAITTLEQHDDLRFTLQEQYQYIMLDEFQDTNPAQLKMISLLTDNVVYERRPNVLAVGDDDQAIYAFQGASYSNMRSFVDMYDDVRIVPLTDNYRSHHDILHVAHTVAEQIEERIHMQVQGVQKVLRAANESIAPTASIERHEFVSDSAELRWTAERIAALIKKGVDPSEIAVLAPKHRFLEPLIPYLNELHIPSVYEKRENVLDDPVIQRLATMSQLVVALSRQDMDTANGLWPEILSYEFWDISTERIWQLSWEAYTSHEPWHVGIMQQDSLKQIGLFFTRLGQIMPETTLEMMLDYLIGVSPLEIPGAEAFSSPFYEHYFGAHAEGSDILKYWHTLSLLTVLREKLRDYKNEEDTVLMLQDFVKFVEAYKNAEIKIINTSPYRQADSAVQVMTAYKSKGLEFQAVFLLSCSDEVWGKQARNASSTISLPANLQHIRYAGANNDERLRLFFVALTRAKEHLYLTSHLRTHAARPSSRLSYLASLDPESNENPPQVPLMVAKHVERDDSGISALAELSSYWYDRHLQERTQPNLTSLLRDRLASYQLSASGLNSFIDTTYGGPRHFFQTSILRFPKAPRPDGQYGNAIHETMQWIHLQQKQLATLPETNQIIAYFQNQLKQKKLSAQDTQLFQDRGAHALQQYMQARHDDFLPSDEHEKSFRGEGASVGDALLTGTIDKLRINKELRTITVLDYKTGKSFRSWIKTEPKLHKYKQQLILYKILVEHSRTYKGYRVTHGILDFVEPDEEGNVHQLSYEFSDTDTLHLERLIRAVWNKIMNLDFPAIDAYDATVKGMLAFEADLISGDV